MRSIHANTLNAIISTQFSYDNLPQLVIIAHHPVVVPPGTSTLFTKSIRKMNDVENVISEYKDSMKDIIYSDQGIGHSHVLYRQAAINGICSLVKLTNNLLLVQDLVRPFENFLKDLPVQWGKLNKDEIGIFHTPEGEIWGVAKLR
jgi:hypothetical protein